MLAARRYDAEDIAILTKHLGLSSPEDVLALCTGIFPAEPVPIGPGWRWTTRSDGSESHGGMSRP
jgi:hypothetical protein